MKKNTYNITVANLPREVSIQKREDGDYDITLNGRSYVGHANVVEDEDGHITVDYTVNEDTKSVFITPDEDDRELYTVQMDGATYACTSILFTSEEDEEEESTDDET